MRLLSNADQQHHAKELEVQGYTILENAIDTALLAELNDALAQTEQVLDAGYSQTAFEGKRTVRLYNLLAQHRAFEKIPVSPTVLSVVEQALDAQLQLSSLSAICIASGEVAQPIHSDSQMIPLPRPHAPIAINSMWALTDFTEANGATRIVPGSHRLDHNPVYGRDYKTVSAQMPAGSILLWSSTLWHGGGANVSGQRRDGIACYYCAGWVRPQENQALGLKQARLRQFERRLQELCGYSVYRGIYGHVDNKDPIVLLGRKQTQDLVWQASEKQATSKSP